MLSRDKELAKKILKWHAVPVPAWRTYPLGRKVMPPKVNRWPRIVKSVSDESSTGISQASVVHSGDELIERVRFMHEHHGVDVMVEDYIDGREIYVGVMGNQRLQTFPPWELFLENLREDAPRIATARLKFDVKYQKKIGANTRMADPLPNGLAERLPRLAKRIYRALGLSGFARIDLRMDADGRVYVLEANPNPDLCFGEDFAESAELGGLKYPQLIQRILNLGLAYTPAWKAG